MSKFRIYYHIENDGAGAANVNLHQTQEAAERADEELEEGWGEPCWGYIELETDGTTLKYSDFDDTYKRVMLDAQQRLCNGSVNVVSFHEATEQKATALKRSIRALIIEHSKTIHWY